ncbi:hypothetical protein Avbf_00967 [Armadillidium vulgare]|nr:hypothetical protein Avbf_00967 [Armadillidium vulgare]
MNDKSAFNSILTTSVGNFKEFEFSQAYLFFWDKIERCNYFLNKIVECIRKNEEIEGRLISYLLKEPTCDGGQWDMIVNLITNCMFDFVSKHGYLKWIRTLCETIILILFLKILNSGFLTITDDKGSRIWIRNQNNINIFIFFVTSKYNWDIFCVQYNYNSTLL